VVSLISVWILAHEGPLRLGAFLGVLALVGLAEMWAPRRRLTQSKGVRWLNNLVLVALNTLVLRVTFPFLAVGMAMLALQRGWGLLSLLVLPPGLDIVATVVVLDAAIYAQHVAFHYVPVLWRLHRMHHADLDFDVTTGARFHPVEILLSMGIKLALVVALGAHPAGVVLFEVLLNATSMFNHGNVRLPLALERRLRWFVVTPDMHRVHHSWVRAETDSNFGFNLPWWDRLFRTYRDQPAAGHDGMTIGLPSFRDPRELWLDRLITQPVRKA
jgi:sterol desaturase/sphingolipid hydroxylase (fatty acid hydroxylase superfamily)